METGKNQGVILEAKGMVKDFSGQRALDGVDFDVRAGEVHALIGENGAGKSTLIKIIAGLFRADDGEILLDGKRVNIASPRDSQDLGLAFIHQDLNVVPHLSVAENIYLGRYPKSAFGLVRVAKMAEMARTIPEAVPINADLRMPVGALPLIEQWKTVINRALAMNSRIIFMDEPTTSLTHSEVEELFNAISHLKERGKAIVYVSHRMEEIFKLADRVTVIKDAKKVGTAPVSVLNSGQLYSMMLGRELEDVFPAKDPPREKVCLEVKNLSRGKAVRDVSFQLREGEILGLAGLVGSGRTELARLLFGADRKDRGDIFINGERADIGSPLDAIRKRYRPGAGAATHPGPGPPHGREGEYYSGEPQTALEIREASPFEPPKRDHACRRVRHYDRRQDLWTRSARIFAQRRESTEGGPFQMALRQLVGPDTG